MVRPRLLILLLLVMSCLTRMNGLAAASPACATAWHIQPSPNPGGSSNIVGVVSFPGGTAWAVGFTAPPIGGFGTAALHEVGGTWTQIPTPNPDPVSNRLDALDGLSDDDVWAVGSRQTGEDGTLIEHWDGSAWTVVPSPSVPHTFSSLDGVSVVGPDDAWAVGYMQNFAGTWTRTLIERWDGRAWTIVPSPNPGDYNFLLDVSAMSTDGVWAVGTRFDVSGTHNLAMHWNGQAWRSTPVPGPGLEDNSLEGLVAIGTDDVWAVGYAADDGVISRKPVTLHWNGTAWHPIDGPDVSGQLIGVAAAPDGTLWAAGYHEQPLTSLIERWNGQRWKVARSENVYGASDTALFGVAIANTPDSAWAVGSSANAQSRLRAIVEHQSCDP
jgi:hypothetical protein